MERNMKKTAAVIILLLTATTLYAGWKYSDYTSTDYKNFRNNPIFQQKIDPEKIDYPLANAAIFFMTNEIRVKNGLKPLDYSEELEIAAWHHSKLMAEKKFFSHTNSLDSTRRTPTARGKLAGITNPSLAENIAENFGITYRAGATIYPRNIANGEFSYTSNGPIIPFHTYLSLAESLVTQWMNSPGHRRNILSGSALQMGCGVYFYRDRGFYNILKCRATQNFQWFKPIVKGERADRLPSELK